MDMEKALLGSIILDGKRIYEAMLMVRPEDLGLGSHREIYRVLIEMASAGTPIDYRTVIEELRKAGSLQMVGGASYVTDLDGLPANIKSYAKAVVANSRRRRLASLCELGTKIISEGETLDSCMERMESGLLSIRSDESKPEATALKGFALEVVNRLIAMRDTPGELIGLPTGVAELDQSTTGIREGELWIVGALPGRGKTALGIQIAAENAKRGTPVAFFSLEMARDQLYLRLLSGESGVKAAKIRNPRYLNDSDMQYISQTASDTFEWPLYIDDASSLTVHELTARAKLYIRRYGVKLLVVDYLRLIESPGKELRERVANAANALRQIAKDERVQVVALSQLKRPPNINDRPTMIDLKESGDVEAHAHVVILLYQPMDNSGEFTHEDELIIGKSRNGPLGNIKVVFDTKSLRFLPRENQ